MGSAGTLIGTHDVYRDPREKLSKRYLLELARTELVLDGCLVLEDFFLAPPFTRLG